MLAQRLRWLGLLLLARPALRPLAVSASEPMPGPTAGSPFWSDALLAVAPLVGLPAIVEADGEGCARSSSRIPKDQLILA